MPVYSINIDRFSVDIYTELNLVEKYHALCKSNQPPLFNCKAFPTDSGYTVFHKNSPHYRVTRGKDQRTLYAYYPSAVLHDGETLYYIAYPLLEKQLQAAGFLTCHAACVSFNDSNGVLLLGKIGSGKTTTSIQLCRNYGARLVGNDLCVLGMHNDKPFVLTGTSYLFLREESIRRNLPDLIDLFPVKSNKDTWTNKILVNIENIGIYRYPGKVPIVQAYMLHVDKSQPLFINKADSLVTRLYLNENFTRYIRTTCLALLLKDNLKFLGYMPSFDEEAFYKNRVQLIEMLLNSGMEYVSGDIGSVTDYIASSVKKRQTR